MSRGKARTAGDQCADCGDLGILYEITFIKREFNWISFDLVPSDTSLIYLPLFIVYPITHVIDMVMTVPMLELATIFERRNF